MISVLAKPFEVAIPDRFQQEGWRVQLQRVERWQRRTLVALDRSGKGEAPEDPADLLYAFFQSAYHLKDWLKNDNALNTAVADARPGFRREVEAYVANSPALQFCRAIANGSKHVVLNDKQNSIRIGIMREYVPPGPGSPDGGTRLRLLAFEDHDGAVNYQYVDELMSDCVVAWRTFCASLPDGSPASS
jgi:hypothetical protein